MDLPERPDVSVDQARVIMTWRRELHCTWRRVADLFCQVWPREAADLDIAFGNQEDGRWLVDNAMTVLGIEGED